MDTSWRTGWSVEDTEKVAQELLAIHTDDPEPWCGDPTETCVRGHVKLLSGHVYTIRNHGHQDGRLMVKITCPGGYIIAVNAQVFLVVAAIRAMEQELYTVG